MLSSLTWRRVASLFLPILLGSLLASISFAQAASDATDQSVIELSPFEVSSVGSDGYGASESMTGSRVAVKIIDLPYSVNVLTSEFFEDFALFELNDNLAYISSFTDLDQGGSFNLRGFRSTVQLRDGFFRLGRYGSSNVDRVEVIKGPNAAIYGQTSPGGMVNMISKKPTNRNSLRFSVSAGDFDTLRATAEYNGIAGPEGKTRYLAILGYYNRMSETPLDELTNKEGYLAIQHVFSPTSSLLLQAEFMDRNVDSSSSAAPFIIDDKNTATANDDKVVGIAKGLATLQQRGSESYLNRGMRAYTATYTKTFNRTFSLRASGNLYHAFNENYNNNVAAGTVNGRTLVMQRGAFPEFGAIYEDGGGVQVDLLANYRTGKIEHRTLVTLEYNDYYRYDPALRISGADLAAWTPIRTFTVLPDFSGPAAPIPFLTTEYNPATGNLRRDNKNRTSITGTLIRHQAAFMDGRLLAFGGARLDYVKYRLNDRLAGNANRFSFKEVTPNLGASYKFSEGWRAFANYSEGFFPNAQSITASVIDANYDSERAQGFEYGIKGSLLDDRLTFTVNAFRIERQNVRVNDIDPVTQLPVVTFEGAQLVRGVELDATWSMTDALSIGLSVGHVNSEITDLGFRTASIGRSPARISPYNGGAHLRYRIVDGRLRGLSFNVGVTYFARTPVSNADAGDTYTNGVLVRSTEEWRQTVPGMAIVNAGLRYRLPTSRDARWGHTLGLNVNNALDTYYLKSSRQLGDPRSFFLNYTMTR